MLSSDGSIRDLAYSLSDRDFTFVCNFVYERTGIVLGEQKRELVYRRLMKLVRKHKLASFGSYCDLLRTEDEDVVVEFVNAITTNLTSFYRERHHFKYLQDELIPKLVKTRPERRIRIWSSACSTGEEPYSIAMTLAQTLGPRLPQWDVKILATDIDTQVLNVAKNGVYDEDRIADLTDAERKMWFKKGKGDNSNLVRVDPGLKDLIVFKPLNLLESWPFRGPFDVIFCRNVLIYFDRQTQDQIILRFSEYLRPGGVLMLGHSENIGAGAAHFQSRVHTAFEKQSDFGRVQ